MVVTDYRIKNRHHFLQRLIGTKAEEDKSLEQSQFLVSIFTSFMIVICLLEIFMYFLYNRKVRKLKTFKFMNNILYF